MTQIPPILDKRDAGLAYALLRATLGLNILIHGFSRIVAGPGAFAAGLVKLFQQTFLPASMVSAFGFTLPWIEAVLGLLLFIGAVSRPALVAGSILMLVLTFGSTLRQDWESAGLQLIYALIYALLLTFRHFNTFSLDGFFGKTDRESSHAE